MAALISLEEFCDNLLHVLRLLGSIGLEQSWVECGAGAVFQSLFLIVLFQGLRQTERTVWLCKNHIV